MKKNYNLFFSIIWIILFFVRCDGVIIDSNGIVLPGVISVFRHYKPLIEEKMDEINQKHSLSKEQIEYMLHPDTDRREISLDHLNAIGQTVFLRPANLERKDTSSNTFLPYTNREVFDLFGQIGDVGDVYPKKNFYEYILLNGSTVGNMRDRIKTLIDVVHSQKITITSSTEIVFLTGERDLFDTETEEQLLNPSPLPLNPSWKRPVELPKTEDQAAEWIWYQAQLPEVIRKAKITFVRAKKKQIEDSAGNIRTTRPTTFDTVKTWIEENNPKPGNCVSVSSQPHVYYQEAIMQGLFKKMNLIIKGFSVEGIGCDDANNFEAFKNEIAVVLDNLARTIYAEVQNAQ